MNNCLLSELHLIVSLKCLYDTARYLRALKAKIATLTCKLCVQFQKVLSHHYSSVFPAMFLRTREGQHFNLGGEG